MAEGLKLHCQKSLNECGFDGCENSGISKLLQCSRYDRVLIVSSPGISLCNRCKTAFYASTCTSTSCVSLTLLCPQCDRDHQKISWPFHKATCFPAVF